MKNEVERVSAEAVGLKADIARRKKEIRAVRIVVGVLKRGAGRPAPPTP